MKYPKKEKIMMILMMVNLWLLWSGGTWSCNEHVLLSSVWVITWPCNSVSFTNDTLLWLLSHRQPAQLVTVTPNIQPFLFLFLLVKFINYKNIIIQWLYLIILINVRVWVVHQANFKSKEKKDQWSMCEKDR